MSMKNSIPAVTEVAAIAKNKSVTVQWKVDKGLLQSGVYATFRVYSAIDLLGPFEQVNFYGFLSTTVNVKAGGETIDPNLLSYTVNYLENGKKYYFKIVPVNAFGTEGISSITVDAATADPANLSPPNNVSIKKSGALLKITFQEKGNYKIFRSQARKGPYILQYPPADILLETTDIWYDNNVQDGKDYWYIFYRTDGKNMGAAGDTLHYFNAETAAPMAPQNVKATASKGLISISWDPNKEEDLLGYEIERASDAKAYSRFLLTKNPIKNNFYKDTLQYLSRTIFHYLVYAIDQNYNRSRPSKIVAAQMPDFDPPAKPYITGLIEKDSNVKIEWEPPFDKDIAAYRIYKKLNTAVNWEKNGDTKFLFFYDKAIAGTWDYAVTAIDSNKNESPFSAVQTIWVHADKSLKTPVNGSIELKDGAVLLQWKPAPGSDPKGWQISRIANNQFIDLAELSATTLNYTDQFPVSGKLKYEIRATNAEYQMGVPLVLEIEFKP
jgi:fibronectin type 3 domain-containing protein